MTFSSITNIMESMNKRNICFKLSARIYISKWNDPHWPWHISTFLSPISLVANPFQLRFFTDSACLGLGKICKSVISLAFFIFFVSLYCYYLFNIGKKTILCIYIINGPFSKCKTFTKGRVSSKMKLSYIKSVTFRSIYASINQSKISYS